MDTLVGKTKDGVGIVGSNRRPLGRAPAETLRTLNVRGQTHLIARLFDDAGQLDGVSKLLVWRKGVVFAM